jgi:hypothetical protein
VASLPRESINAAWGSSLDDAFAVGEPDLILHYAQA